MQAWSDCFFQIQFPCNQVKGMSQPLLPLVCKACLYLIDSHQTIKFLCLISELFENFYEQKIAHYLAQFMSFKLQFTCANKRSNSCDSQQISTCWTLMFSDVFNGEWRCIVLFIDVQCYQGEQYFSDALSFLYFPRLAHLQHITSSLSIVWSWYDILAIHIFQDLIGHVDHVMFILFHMSFSPVS